MSDIPEKYQARLTANANDFDKIVIDICNENKELQSKVAEQAETISKLDIEPFIVHVEVMKESHQTTYWVCLDRGDRPKNAMPWADGRITPFKHTNKEYADEEAKTWAKFLDVEVTVLKRS